MSVTGGVLGDSPVATASEGLADGCTVNHRWAEPAKAPLVTALGQSQGSRWCCDVEVADDLPGMSRPSVGLVHLDGEGPQPDRLGSLVHAS